MQLRDTIIMKKLKAIVELTYEVSDEYVEAYERNYKATVDKVECAKMCLDPWKFLEKKENENQRLTNVIKLNVVKVS
jgi:hypothetical protein